MRAYVFVDDSDDEQMTTLHDAGTGELLPNASFQLGPMHSGQTLFGVALHVVRELISVRFFPTLFPQ